MSKIAAIRFAAASLAFAAVATSAQALTVWTGTDAATARQQEITSNSSLNAPTIHTGAASTQGADWLARSASRESEFVSGFKR